MMQPIEKALRLPIMLPIFPPVIMSVAITSVYRVMAVWIPVMVVPRSAATVAIDTFITELSSVIRNWLLAKTAITKPAPAAWVGAGGAGVVTR